jgi:hypothetical protein
MRVSDRLRVVARGEGDDTALARFGLQRRDRIVGAAELEGARALQVLSLEIEFRAGRAVGGTRGQYRRPVRDARDAGRRQADILERRQA